MKYTRLIGTVIAFCMAVPLFAQQYKATIPYRIVGEKMVIEMKVNGNARPFIFDTGGRTALTTKACQALQITATDSMKVTDVNNVESYYKTTRIENLTTPDDVINFKNAPSLIINEVKGWECFGVDGIIGSDLFASTIVSIDSQTKNIIVTSAEKPSTVSLRKMLNFTKEGGMPIVNVQIAPVSNITVLFDTGSPSLLSLIESDFERIKPEASMEVVSEGYGEGSIIGKNYKIKQLKTMVLPKNPFFTELGVVGILGGDAFAQSVVTFDSRSKIMVINYPYRPEKLKVTDGIPLLDETEHHSIVNVRLGNNDLKVLFDTGAGGFLLYCTEDYNRLADISQVTNHGYGIVAAGITGLGKPVDIKKVSVPSINIMGKEFTNVGSTTTVMNGTIIGVDLLKYGKVIIDYMRRRFYFLPFEEGKIDMGGAPALWNVSILPRNERFEITTIWDSMKDAVAFGDEVININGTSLKDCPMSQMAVEEIMNAIPGDTGYIIIKKYNQEKRIEIRKEK